MKKIVFLILCFTFSMSVSAHQSTTAFQNQIVAKTHVQESSQLYIAGNGGILQLIYTVFYKLGTMASTALHTPEITKSEELANVN